MTRQVNRRRVLSSVAGVATVGVAGCLSSCQGDPTVKQIDKNPDKYVDSSGFVSVKGNLKSVRREVAMVDDGTGTAAVTPGPLYEWNPSSMSSGTCVVATGTYAGDLESEYSADIVLVDGSIREA